MSRGLARELAVFGIFLLSVAIVASVVSSNDYIPLVPQENDGVVPICMDLGSDSNNIDPLDGNAMFGVEGAVCSGNHQSAKKCRATAAPISVCDSVSKDVIECSSNSNQACVYKCNGTKWVHQTYCTSNQCATDGKSCKP